VREPKILLGDEEKVYQEGNSINPFGGNFAIEEIPKSDKISLSTYYATPLDGVDESGGPDPYGYRWEKNKYNVYLYQDNPVYLLSKNDIAGSRYLEENVVFGYPSHFDAYAGTPISISDLFLLTYIGFKISDPSLVKDLRIELSNSAGSGELGMGKEGKLSDFILPTAYACGGGSYHLVGESKLEYVKESAGVHWFALKTPILTDNVNTMQVSYIPNKKEGLISFELSDMIFQDKTGNLMRPQFKKEEYDFCSEYRPQSKEKADCYADKMYRSAYRAYLAPEEKGNIAFKQDGQNKKILMSLGNNGKDTFVIDKNSINSIQAIFDRDEPIDKINIRSKEGGILYTFSMEDIKKQVVGKTVEPASAIPVPLNLNDLKNDASYWVTLGRYKIDNYVFSVDSGQRKIIHWTFGDNSYSYAPIAWDDRVLYELYIDDQGVMALEKPNASNLPK